MIWFGATLAQLPEIWRSSLLVLGNSQAYGKSLRTVNPVVGSLGVVMVLTTA